MKKSLATAALLCTSLQIGAQAADLPARSTPAPIPAAPAFTWSQLYIGANMGTGFGNTTIDVPGALNIQGLGSNGLTFGVTGGVDYQFAPKFVAGLAVDANADKIDTTIGGPGLGLKARDEWSWAVRGRVGYLLTPETLVYATGGWTQMHSQLDSAGLSNSQTRNGWLIGAGVDARLWGNWFTHAEYFYTSYERTILPGTTIGVEPHGFTGRAGLTYRFGALGPAYAATDPVISRSSWTGFYAGLQFGYGQANTKISADPTFSLRGIGSSGVAGGLVAGYDWQVSPMIVIGAEGDVSASTLQSKFTTFGADIRAKGDWDWSARGRAGLLFTPSTLSYVTAGYAQTHVSLNTGGLFDWSHQVGGIQYGGGAETLITPNVSVRAEWLQTIYSKQTVLAPLAIRPNEGKARIGVTYKFGGDSAPVLAKY